MTDHPTADSPFAPPHLKPSDVPDTDRHYGRLTVVCGPMFSGKTTELLKRILWARNGLGQNVQVFKPAFDQRYSRERLVSHEGLASDALAIGHWDGVSERLIEQNVRTVFFDEIQFFVEPHFDGNLVQIVRDLLLAGIDVCCAGLDMDWQGIAFHNTAMLGAMAEEMVKISGHCTVCGQPSTRSFKRTGAGASIELGGAELYEPRCTKHWFEEVEQERLV